MSGGMESVEMHGDSASSYCSASLVSVVCLGLARLRDAAKKSEVAK